MTRQEVHAEYVKRIAHEVIQRICDAYNAPSMGFDDGVDWEKIVMGNVLIEHPTIGEEELEQAIYEIELQELGVE